MSKFNVGDKVRIRKDLIVNEKYSNITFISCMKNLADENKVHTIEMVDDNTITLENELFWWGEDMLEPVEENKEHIDKLEPPKIAVSHPDPVGDKGPAGPRFTRLIGNYDKGKDVLSDMVNHPQHYAFKYEPIDVINDWELDFNLGNTVKYIARCERKGNKIQDLEKAKFYLDDEIRRLKKNGIK